MKRLLELPVTDRLTERAHVLIRATGGTVESEARLLRVRRSLDVPRSEPRRWTFRSVLVACLLGASAAAASGAFLGVFEAAQPVVSSPGALAVVPQPRVTAPASEPAAAPPASASAEPSRSAPPEARRPTSDVARVHEAATALRRDRDPARALQLLERSGSPIVGPLAEEALALRVEASMALGPDRAKRLATAYLAKYPNGRYRELAKRAQAGSAR